MHIIKSVRVIMLQKSCSDDDPDGNQRIRISPEVYNIPAVKPSAGPFSDSGIEDKTNTITDDMSIVSYNSEVRKHMFIYTNTQIIIVLKQYRISLMLDMVMRLLSCILQSIHLLQRK